MVREFKEEAGADIGGWYSFGVMDGSFGMVHLFRACVEDLDTIGIKTMTDEPIEIHTIDAVYNDKSIGVLYNVQMLLRVAESLDLVYTTFQY
jgi:8-oxo-dGTP pyrophosphatase MutT (NUDIX family)